MDFYRHNVLYTLDAGSLIREVEIGRDRFLKKGIYPEVLHINRAWLKDISEYLKIEVTINHELCGLKLDDRNALQRDEFVITSPNPYNHNIDWTE